MNKEIKTEIENKIQEVKKERQNIKNDIIQKITTPRVRKYKIETDEDWDVEIKIGDKVMDMFGDSGIFHVEEIRRSDGWVWGSEMKQPYYDGDKKNFHDYHMTWLV